MVLKSTTLGINKEEVLPDIAIIDMDSILFSAAHGHKVYIEDDEDGNPVFERDDKGRLVYIDKTVEEMFESLDDIMTEILNTTSSTGYISFIKGKGKGFRYSINPTYKHNRPKESPKWWGVIRDYAIKNWNAISVDGDLEVDDAVNIARLQIPNSFIVAIDQDLLNLEGQYHYNWRKNVYIHTSEEEAFYAFWQDMVVGQTGDGLSGIPGYGKVYYNKNIRSLDPYYVPSAVLRAYLDVLGEYEGINSFYRHYNCLKIIDDPERLKIELNVNKWE